jgi:hypothetical protein
MSCARAQALNRLHRLFPRLLASGAPVKKFASQYKALLATVQPRDLAGKTCRRMTAEELAARILADVGDITRFPSRGHFASWNGAGPIDASSGQHTRHRLSCAGNRRSGHVLYIVPIVQLRNDTPGRAYYRSKLQRSKTSMEAMRCLRRRLSNASTASSSSTPPPAGLRSRPARESPPRRHCRPARPAWRPRQLPNRTLTPTSAAHARQLRDRALDKSFHRREP